MTESTFCWHPQLYSFHVRILPYSLEQDYAGLRIKHNYACTNGELESSTEIPLDLIQMSCMLEISYGLLVFSYSERLHKVTAILQEEIARKSPKFDL